MRLVPLILAIAFGSQAGVVRGVVLEYASGLPLARTPVRLQPVPRAAGGEVRAFQTRAGVAGQFAFSGVPDGLYLVIATRQGYFPAAHGQRRPAGQGVPVEVTRDSDLFSDLRMRRKGALTGRVLDENGVGLPGVPVIAYRARLPLRPVGRAQADDRGVYRIHGLEPGKYWIRTAPYTLEDGSGRLPTFGPESRDLRHSRVHQVKLDADTLDADVRPEPGTLFRLRGIVTCTEPGMLVNVMLASETGRRRAQTTCPQGSYMFESLAPALYEVYAETVNGAESGFLELFLDRDNERGSVQLAAAPEVEFEVRRAGSPGRADIPVTLRGRRLEISEADDERDIPLPRARLAAGYWEMRATVTPGQFVESIGGSRYGSRRAARPERSPEWHDVQVESRGSQRVIIVVSSEAAQIGGSVIAEGKSVPGAPVFLWPVAESARRSLSGARQTLSDTGGRFHFDSLPAGEYRLLSSFDISEIEEEVLEEARAGTIRAEASRVVSIELPLWSAP